MYVALEISNYGKLSAKQLYAFVPPSSFALFLEIKYKYRKNEIGNSTHSLAIAGRCNMRH